VSEISVPSSISHAGGRHAPCRTQHALADEIGDEAVGRPVIEVVGHIPLLDAALVHDADLVGHGEGFVLVVGDHDRGHALALQDLAHLDRQAFAQADIEVGERLVEQDQFRPRRQRAGQRHALLLAAGEFVRILVALAMQADRGQQLATRRWASLRRLAAEAEGDVLFDGQVRKQRVILKDHADRRFSGGTRCPARLTTCHVQADLAAGDLLEAGNAAQQGGLAATRGAEQAGDAALLRAKIDAIDDGLLP
jgi:hypothetical protein